MWKKIKTGLFIACTVGIGGLILADQTGETEKVEVQVDRIQPARACNRTDLCNEVITDKGVFRDETRWLRGKFVLVSEKMKENCAYRLEVFNSNLSERHVLSAQELSCK